MGTAVVRSLSIWVRAEDVMGVIIKISYKIEHPFIGCTVEY